jgi:4,5-DOPA dioxygenase extradiol
MDTTRMPVIFIGHGSPMNALEKNEFTDTWKALARQIPLPGLILSISAHWSTRGTAVTGIGEPETIHDFFGFPQELYGVRYRAKGSPESAGEIARLITTVDVRPDFEWGLDHGTWAVLVNMYPDAAIPVLQLSLDLHMPPEKHYHIGQELSSLRDRGVLIMGSGDIVHNLMMMNPGAEPYPWALQFEDFVKESLSEGKHEALMAYKDQESSAQAHPTEEHYIPLLYVIGAAGKGKPRVFNEKIYAASISMTCFVFNGEE